MNRLNIFGWPLFLPVCIARDYYTLWTEERMQKIIAALKKRNLAVEINDLAHTPHEKFILMAKEQGLKFTFGSDTRDQKAGRLDYCKYIAKKCNLKRDDFFIPQRALNRRLARVRIPGFESHAWDRPLPGAADSLSC